MTLGTSNPFAHSPDALFQITQFQTCQHRKFQQPLTNTAVREQFVRMNRITNEINKPVKYSRAEKRSRKLDEINDAAAAIFLRDGYAEFSARKVAKEIGISLSNLQHYCGNTENLYIEMIKSKLERYVIRFEEIYLNDSMPPLERFELAIRENMLATMDDMTGRLFFQIGALATLDAQTKKIMIDQYDHFLSGMKYLVTLINPQLSTEKVQTYSGLIATMIEGNFFYLWQPSMPPQVRADMITTAVDLWCQILTGKPYSSKTNDAKTVFHDSRT
ncbi:TetR/AcrR family transcriptional regulator [Pseudomonas frederiksbergensis]|nr:TetR/AcrR family transcriptional regulator [Pseudomonas frederiksbergensis]